MTPWSRWLPWVGLAVFLPHAAALAQDSEDPPRGWEFAGVPSIGFDSDEGFGFGAVVELYDYGPEGGFQPYRLTLQPNVSFTTEGRREATLFFDAPYLIEGGWRFTAELAWERHIATPYYGVGNDTPYDETLDRDSGPNPYYYRFGRTRRRLSVDVQRGLSGAPVRFLAGIQLSKTRLDTTPKDEGTTLLATELEAGGREVPGGLTSRLRGGLIWDTRDREVGPRSGVWSEVLVSWSNTAFGSEQNFVQWSVTDRRYRSLSDRLVFANRFLLQNTVGDPFFYELQLLQGSFKAREGLGGSATLRGIPKNRYTGEGLFLWNAELRLRVAEFTLLSRGFHLVLSGFLDSGRVWAGDVKPGELFQDLHHAYGGGLRVGMGENFVAALDVGDSDESGMALYTGLGYLY